MIVAYKCILFVDLIIDRQTVIEDTINNGLHVCYIENITPASSSMP